MHRKPDFGRPVVRFLAGQIGITTHCNTRINVERIELKV